MHEFSSKLDYAEYGRAKNGKKYMLDCLRKLSFVNELKKFKFSDKKVLLISKCPIDKVVPLSPINGYLNPCNYPLARDFMLAIHKTLDIIPYAYKDENQGKIFRSIVPIKQEEEMIGSFGSKYEFNFHSDNPTYKIFPEYSKHSLNSPEYLSLYCMRGKQNVATEIISLDYIINNLRADTLEILSKPNYIVNTPDSFDKYHEVRDISVIAKINDKYFTRYDHHNLKGMSNTDNFALKEFENAIKNIKSFSHNFQCGDFLIFKNQETLHKRESFSANYDGYDRWLLRIYGASNPEYLNHEKIVTKDMKCI